jgi:hypothetical protein
MKNTMLAKKLVFSLSFLIASFLILLTATIAWFTILPAIIGPIQKSVSDPEFSSILYIGVDEDFDNIIDQVEGIDQYLPIGFENYNISNWFPGQIKYFKIIIANEGSNDITTSILFEAISNGSAVDDPLADVMLIHFEHPTIPSRVIAGQSFTSLIDGDFISNGFILASDITVLFEESVTVYFSIEMSPDAGNIYQNLYLIIGRIVIIGM